MSRFIVVAPGSSETTTLATDELVRVLGAATVGALAGTTVTDAILRPASALSVAAKAVRAIGDDAFITSAREVSNRAFDRVARNLSLTAPTHAGVILALDAEGASTELLAKEITAARLHAETATASIVAIALTDGAPAVEADVPALNLPLDDEAVATLRVTAAPTAVALFAFQADLIRRTRAERKRIVPPEPNDDHVLQAAVQVLVAGITDITFIGDADYIVKRTDKLGLDLSAAWVTSVNDPVHLECYAEEFAHLYAKEGVALEQTREKVTNVSHFGVMIVHMDNADGTVSGAAHTTAHTIVLSSQVIKTALGVSVVSPIFLMVMKDRVWAFGDCAVNPNPTVKQLTDIAATSARTAAQFGVILRVAMFSYPTGTPGSGPDVDIVIEATHLTREGASELAVEGLIQFDATADTTTAATKLSGSEAAGKTTVFVFPSLEAGNIGYRAVQHSSGIVTVGPVLQSLNKPVSGLSHNTFVEGIVNAVTLTAVQAQD